MAARAWKMNEAFCIRRGRRKKDREGGREEVSGILRRGSILSKSTLIMKDYYSAS